MNVLFISELSNLGGGETSLLNLIIEFNKSKYKIKPFLLCFSEGKLVDESRKYGISTSIIDFRNCFKKKDLKKIYSEVKRIKELIKYNNISVIQTNDWKTSVLVKIICKSFFIKCKVIWVCHGQWYKFNKLKGLLINTLIDKVVAVSKVVEYNLKDNNIDNEKLINIPLGIDIYKFKDASSGILRKEINIKENEKIFGVIGRFQEIKGQELIVDCARKLRDKGLICKFIMVGDSIFGSNKDDYYKEKVINSIYSEKLQDYFIFLGVRRDIPNILKDINALIIPSKNESFGMTVIEAFAAGCLVISTPCDGPKEIIRDGFNSYIIDKRDTNLLCEKIEMVINNNLNIDIIKNNQKVDVKPYSIENICLQYMNIY